MRGKGQRGGTRERHPGKWVTIKEAPDAPETQRSVRSRLQSQVPFLSLSFLTHQMES